MWLSLSSRQTDRQTYTHTVWKIVRLRTEGDTHMEKSEKTEVLRQESLLDRQTGRQTGVRLRLPLKGALT